MNKVELISDAAFKFAQATSDPVVFGQLQQHALREPCDDACATTKAAHRSSESVAESMDVVLSCPRQSPGGRHHFGQSYE